MATRTGRIQPEVATRTRNIQAAYSHVIDEIFRKHGYEHDDARDAFEERVFDVYRADVEMVLSTVAVAFLKEKYPNQTDRAAFLGIDRTTLSRYENNSLPRMHIDKVFNRLRSEIEIPSESEVTRRASVRTISYIRRNILEDVREVDDLTLEKLAFIFEMLLSDDWLEAISGDSVSRLREVFDQLSARVRALKWVRSRRVVCYGQMVYVMEVWYDAFLLGIGVIPYWD